MTQQIPQLTSILKDDLGISPGYKHIPKRVTPGEALEPSGVVLKWHAVYQDDRPVPDEITQLARSYLTTNSLEARGLGFVLLHRCGKDFYFLIVSTWRGSNEIWETVSTRMVVRWTTSRCSLVRKATSQRSAFGSWRPSGTRSGRGSDPGIGTLRSLPH